MAVSSHLHYSESRFKPQKLASLLNLTDLRTEELLIVPLGVNIFLCSMLAGLAGFGDCVLDASADEVQASSFLSRNS